jgi:hypothetical protein
MSASVASRLYRHAIESIFAFVSLEDLAALLCINHEWRAAVSSMACCSLEWSLTKSTIQIPLMCASPAARHITSIEYEDNTKGGVMSNQLALMRLHLPRLAKLTVCLAADDALTPDNFPAHLTYLHVLVHYCATSAVTQSVIDAIAQLSSLESLFFYAHDDQGWHPLRCTMSFAPLAHLPRLRSLYVNDVVMSATNVLELRNLHALRVLHGSCAGHDLTPDTLFAAPHKLLLTELGWTSIKTDRDAAGLATLTDMVKLELHANAVGHADFLQSMPQLTDLNMQFSQCFDAQPVDVLRVVTTLQRCTQLKKLTLIRGDFRPTPTQCIRFLSCMPLLAELCVDVTGFTSLAWLSVGTLPHTLRDLALSSENRSMPFTEMHHLHTLLKLETLGIDDRLTEYNRHHPAFQPYKVPSVRMPALRTLYFHNYRGED